MRIKKILTKYTGVRYYEHDTRKLRSGGLDRYHSIRFKLKGKDVEEGLGWASEGWNPEKANAIRSQLRQAQKTGVGPSSLSEMREKSQKLEEVAEEKAKREETAAMTLADFFKNHYIPRARKEKRTWQTDEQRIAKLINPALGHMPFAALKKADIQTFVDDLDDSGAAASTVKHYMAIIRRAYNMASEIVICDTPIFSGTNPAKGVRLPAVCNARERYLTGDEADLLISAAAKLPDRDLHDAIVISLNTGLRLGEIRRLKWFDIDFLANFLTVREEAQRKPGGKVPINQKAKDILLSRKNAKNVEPTDLVFPPLYGQSLRENMSHHFTALANRLGLNQGLDKDDRRGRVVFHSLRHTFASWLAMAGVDIYRIKSLMRHKTLEMTMRYAHLIPDATQDAVNQLAPPTRK